MAGARGAAPPSAWAQSASHLGLSRGGCDTFLLAGLGHATPLSGPQFPHGKLRLPCSTLCRPSWGPGLLISEEGTVSPFPEPFLPSSVLDKACLLRAMGGAVFQLRAKLTFREGGAALGPGKGGSLPGSQGAGTPLAWVPMEGKRERPCSKRGGVPPCAPESEEGREQEHRFRCRLLSPVSSRQIGDTAKGLTTKSCRSDSLAGESCSLGRLPE